VAVFPIVTEAPPRAYEGKGGRLTIKATTARDGLRQRQGRHPWMALGGEVRPSVPLCANHVVDLETMSHYFYRNLSDIPRCITNVIDVEN
jgi:hypothetical protein